MACQEAVKVYKLDPKTSYKDPPVLLLNKYSENFINLPKTGPAKPSKGEKHPPKILLQPVYGIEEIEEDDEFNHKGIKYKIEPHERKILRTLNEEIKGSSFFGLQANHSNDFRKTRRSPREVKSVVKGHLSILDSVKYLQYASKLEKSKRRKNEAKYGEKENRNRELFRINLMGHIKTQLRVFQESRTYVDIRFSKKQFKYEDIQKLRDLPLKRLHDDDWILAKLTLASNKSKYSDLVTHYVGFGRRLFIFIFNI